MPHSRREFLAQIACAFAVAGVGCKIVLPKPKLDPKSMVDAIISDSRAEFTRVIEAWDTSDGGATAMTVGLTADGIYHILKVERFREMPFVTYDTARLIQIPFYGSRGS